VTVTGSDGITVVVAREVAPGRETEFSRWVDDELLAAAARFTGFLGAGVLEPAAGGAVWHVVYRFDTPEHLAAWEGSPVRTRLLDQGSGFVQTVAVRRLDGMDAWFAPPRTAPAPPPRWKTFVMTATVILVLQTAISTAFRPLTGDWPTFYRTAAIILPLVALMTWVVMPRLSRRLSGWLYRTNGAQR
jgi:antibiotic biosynthesis monooxygenase (ABM) superfamily enzyme